MANEIGLRIKVDGKQATRDIEEFGRRAKSAIEQPRDELGRFVKGANSATQSVGGLRHAFDLSATSVGQLRTSMISLRGVIGTLGVAAAVSGLTQLARVAVDAAINVDKTRQALAALTGSTEAANKNLAELRKLAAVSPGVTTTFATELFTQLKALNEIAEPTINRLIQSIGKLNAIFTIDSPQVFARNLTQIFKGSFERSDVKEALQQVPIFEQILKSAFGTDDPDKLRKLKAAGKLTMDAFLSGIIEAVDKDPRFKDIQESIGAKMAKAKDNILTALAPVGEELTKILLPLFDDLVKAAEKYGGVAVKAFRDHKDAIIDTAREIGRLTIEIGRLIGQIVELGANSGVFQKLAEFAAIITDFLSGDITLFSAGPREAAVQQHFAEAARRRAEEQVRQDARSQLGGLNAFDFTPLQRAQGLVSTPTAAQALAAAKNAGLGATFRIGAGGGAFNPLTGRFGGAGGSATTTTTSTTTGTGRGKSRTAATPVDLLFFAKSREVDIAALERAQEENMRALVTEFREQNELLREQRETRVKLTQAFEAREARLVAEIERDARRDLQRSGRSIGAALSRGQLTGGEAELLSIAANAEAANKLREALAIATDKETIENLREEIALFDQLGSVISDNERFMRGFNSQIETSGDAFERFGQNVSRAFTNIKDVFNGLKNAVFQFFNDILGQGLQNLMRQVLGPIFGGGGGGGGVGNFFNNLFRTPSFAGGGLAAPPSVSLGGIGSLFGGGRTSSGATGIFANGQFAAGLAGTKTSFLGGIGASLAAAAPFAGLALGAGLGGPSKLGNVLGGIGGTLGGLTIGATAGVIGGKLGSAFALSGALGPAALVAAPLLLLGGFFLGKSKQRGKDEEAAGQLLIQAQAQIRQLKAGIANDSIDGGQAKAIFDSQILAQFISGIGQLKTKSVRESRLTNQVADLRKMFDSSIPMEVAAQQQRRFVQSRLIPEFATGGIHSRGGLAVLHPGEMVLNFQQQAAIARMSSPAIFQAAGVPGVQKEANFERGGVMGRGLSDRPIEITLDVQVGVSKSGAREIAVTGMSGAEGRAVIVNGVRVARTNREL